jgi:hypothetical protein
LGARRPGTRSGSPDMNARDTTIAANTKGVAGVQVARRGAGARTDGPRRGHPVRLRDEGPPHAGRGRPGAVRAVRG